MGWAIMNCTTIKKNDAIVSKLNCGKCKKFIGFLRADGCGPYIDECQSRFNSDISKCPMIKATEKYQPRNPSDVIKGCGRELIDDDAGSYQSIARRCLEEGRE
jgi:hypothetical protein